MKNILYLLLFFYLFMDCRPLLPDDPDLASNEKDNQEIETSIKDKNESSVPYTGKSEPSAVPTDLSGSELSKDKGDRYTEGNQQKKPEGQADKGKSSDIQNPTNSDNTSSSETTPVASNGALQEAQAMNSFINRSLLGYVLDYFTKAPIANARISIDETSGNTNTLNVLSGSDGSFNITVNADLPVIYINVFFDNIKTRNAIYAKGIYNTINLFHFNSSKNELIKLENNESALSFINAVEKGVAFLLFEKTKTQQNKINLEFSNLASNNQHLFEENENLVFNKTDKNSLMVNTNLLILGFGITRISLNKISPEGKLQEKFLFDLIILKNIVTVIDLNFINEPAITKEY